jgi:NAD(P)-dependent dehydrogenase (short-subunit alcohol dehydrogenase family)
MINLKGKRIVVTGASSGIGKAVSQKAAILGGSVILFGRNIRRLEETYESLPGSGHELFSIDITNYPQVEKILRSSVAKNGTFGGYVHCAGIEKTTTLRASTPKLFREVFEINVFAGFEMARIISQKTMVDLDGASFVFLSSVMGRLGGLGKIAYCSSKSALLSGVKAMSLEVATKKIRCNCILPGIVETEMIKELFDTLPQEAKKNIVSSHPLGIGKPEDVASLACFLLSEQARWITGAEYIIDGGYSAK